MPASAPEEAITSCGLPLTSIKTGVVWLKLASGRLQDAKQMFILTGAGIVESNDGGVTWSKPIALLKELKGLAA